MKHLFTIFTVICFLLAITLSSSLAINVSADINKCQGKPECEWSFGDGNSTASCKRKQKYSYTDPGTYSVSFHYDCGGLSQTTTYDVKVSPDCTEECRIGHDSMTSFMRDDGDGNCFGGDGQCFGDDYVSYFWNYSDCDETLINGEYLDQCDYTINWNNNHICTKTEPASYGRSHDMTCEKDGYYYYKGKYQGYDYGYVHTQYYYKICRKPASCVSNQAYY